MTRVNFYLIFLRDSSIYSSQNDLADRQGKWICGNECRCKICICIMIAMQTNYCPT